MTTTLRVGLLIVTPAAPRFVGMRRGFRRPELRSAAVVIGVLKKKRAITFSR